jgi:hypothetical protein
MDEGRKWVVGWSERASEQNVGCCTDGRRYARAERRIDSAERRSDGLADGQMRGCMEGGNGWTSIVWSDVTGVNAARNIEFALTVWSSNYSEPWSGHRGGADCCNGLPGIVVRIEAKQVAAELVWSWQKIIWENFRWRLRRNWCIRI